MSLLSSLAISLSGIQAASTRLEIAASNISSASVEGYTKKTALITSTTLGESGSGVQVAGFERATNKALFTTLSGATTDAGKLDVQNEYMQKVLDLLGTSSGDSPALASNMTAFINSWTQLSTEPESTVSQQQVIQASNNLADEIKRLAAGVETLDRQCSSDIDSTLADLNGYLTQLQDMNGKISLLTTTKMSPGGIEDERDALILKISEMMDVTVLNRDNGQIALYTKSGYQLVDGASICSFSYDGTNIYEENNLTFSMNQTLVGGSIEGLVGFRATTSPVSTDSATSVIQKLRDQLDAVTESLISLVTTATSGAETFAAAYNNAAIGTDAVSAHRLLADAMRVTADTAGSTGNSISFTISAGTLANTYKIVVTDGVTPETYDNVNLGPVGGPYDWSAMVTALAPSVLVDATINALGDLDPTTLDLSTVYTLYGGADQAAPDELATDFFTGTDRTNISVNALLLNGTSTIKMSSAGAVTDALLDQSRLFTADGLNAVGSGYRTVITSIMASFQQSAKNILSLSTTSTGQKDYLYEKLANETGVNTDEEMANLVILQQAYTASARVMTVVNDLFTTLVNTV